LISQLRVSITAASTKTQALDDWAGFARP
jgi:hypothetical protein